MQDYGQAIDLDPSNADAWQARALVHLDQGDADKAIEDFNSLLKQNENNVNAHLALAEALTNIDKLDEALPHIEKAIQLKPDSPLGYTMRARWKVLKEDIDGALTDLDQAIKIEPRGREGPGHSCPAVPDPKTTSPPPRTMSNACC